MPAASRDDTLDETPLRWPCCASKRPAAPPPRRSTPPTLRTNRPGLLVPAHKSAAHRSRALTTPPPVCARARTGGSSLPPLFAPAAPPKSARKCDARCGAACAAICGRLSRMASIKGISGPTTGRSRSVRLRSGGCASASAWRTIRRCTPSLRAIPFIVPPPNSYSLRICSNSSTFALLFIPSLLPLLQDAPAQVGWANLQHRSGPFHSIEIGRERAIGVTGPVFNGPDEVATNRLTTEPAVKFCPVMSNSSPNRIVPGMAVIIGPGVWNS